MTKEQEIFINLVEEKVGKGRISFTFLAETEGQVNTALNAIYKSGYVWWDRCKKEAEDIEREIIKAVKCFEKVRFRIRCSPFEDNMEILYAIFDKDFDTFSCDFKFNEGMKFLAELKKSYKEIERGANDNYKSE